MITEKNKETIEKIEKGCREFLPKNFVGDGNIWKCGQWGLVDGINTPFICQSCKDKRKATIKTSVEWCEYFIEILEDSKHWLNEEETDCVNCETQDKLTTHLKWLKEKEKLNGF